MKPTYRFNDDDRSISIFDPNLPSPWINYLSNGRMHAFVSQCAGGPLWWITPINFRLTRYHSWPAAGDGPGFYLYVREKDGTVWSPSWKPCEVSVDAWEARHAPGKSTFVARHGDLEVSLTLFIAQDEDAMVWSVIARNAAKEPVEVDLFGYIELSLYTYPLESSWGYYTRHQFKTFFDEASQSVVYHYHHDYHPSPEKVPLTVFAADRPIASWSGDRQDFLGWNRTFRNPQGVERADCGGSSIWGGEPCAALQVPLRIAGGAVETTHFYVALARDGLFHTEAAVSSIGPMLARYRTPGWTESQEAKLDAWWARHFDTLRLSMPADPASARQIETWTPINCVQTGRYSRSISQFAFGLRGFGYRDTTQDMLAQASREPEWAKREFLRLLNYQFEDGHSAHAYYPDDMQDPGSGGQSDDALWLVMLASQILAETGDTAFLDERTPFLADDRKGPGRDATVWEHLRAVEAFTASHLGAHGIPLTLEGDWNDIIRRLCKVPGGESVMVAQQYAYILGLLADMADLRGETDYAAQCRERQATQRRLVDECCWAGEWWIRAFDGDGKAIGTKDWEHGRIWLNSQTWAVLGGCGSPERRKAGMDAVARYLDTDCGVKKLDPSFPSWPSSEDSFSGFNPGAGENGAIFCHANTWAVIAEALLGRPDRAWKYFRQLVPGIALEKAGLATYQLEPYAYPSSVLGPENKHFGRATLTHITGTAAWMDIAGTQYLLGIRPEVKGLRLAPCLPSDIPGYSAERRWAGCKLAISVRKQNPEAPAARVLSATLDGTPLDLSDDSAFLTREMLAGKSDAHVELMIGAVLA